MHGRCTASLHEGGGVSPSPPSPNAPVSGEQGITRSPRHPRTSGLAQVPKNAHVDSVVALLMPQQRYVRQTRHVPESAAFTGFLMVRFSFILREPEVDPGK